MRVASFTEIEFEFIERAHRMVWCDLATVGPDGRPRTRVVHPVWEGDTARTTCLRVGPKADVIECNQAVGNDVLRFQLVAGELIPVAFPAYAAH